jgi:hypothetical protein
MDLTTKEKRKKKMTTVVPLPEPDGPDKHLIFELSAAVIQFELRGFFARRCKCVVRIQSLYRCHVAHETLRKKVVLHEKREKHMAPIRKRLEEQNREWAASRIQPIVRGWAGRMRAWHVWMQGVIVPAAMVIQRAVRRDNAITELAGRRWQRDDAMERAVDVAYRALHASYKAVEQANWWVVHKHVEAASAIAATASRRARRVVKMALIAAEDAKVRKWAEWLEAAIPTSAGPWWHDPKGGAERKS